MLAYILCLETLTLPSPCQGEGKTAKQHKSKRPRKGAFLKLLHSDTVDNKKYKQKPSDCFHIIL